MLRRLDDRIRALCAKAVKSQDPAELHNSLCQLRAASVSTPNGSGTQPSTLPSYLRGGQASNGAVDLFASWAGGGIALCVKAMLFLLQQLVEFDN